MGKMPKSDLEKFMIRQEGKKLAGRSAIKLLGEGMELFTGALSTKAGLATGQFGLTIGGIAQMVDSALKAFGASWNLTKGLWRWAFNDDSWYTSNGPITPALNLMRPMQPVSNEGITDNVTFGSVPPVIHNSIAWGDYTKTLAFDRFSRRIYENIRANLKSNLPWTLNDLKAYLINSIYYHFCLKEMERDLGWAKFVPDGTLHFQELWRSRSAVNFGGSYGLSQAIEDPRFSDVAFNTAITQQPVLFELAQSFPLPTNLAKWIDHYVGQVFINDDDGAATQFIVNHFFRIPYCTGIAEGELVIEMRDINWEDPSIMLRYMSSDLDRFSTIKADITHTVAKSDCGFALASLGYQGYGEYIPVAVMDPTFLQAIVNAYTTSEGVLQGGEYVRLDYMQDALKDSITTFLFMQPLSDAVNTEDNILKSPLFSVLNQSVTFYSNGRIKIPSGVTQVELTPDHADQYLTLDEGVWTVTVGTDVASDIYVSYGYTSDDTVQPVVGSGKTLTASGNAYINIDAKSSLRSTNTSSTISLTNNNVPNVLAFLLPICRVCSAENQVRILCAQLVINVNDMSTSTPNPITVTNYVLVSQNELKDMNTTDDGYYYVSPNQVSGYGTVTDSGRFSSVFFNSVIVEKSYPSGNTTRFVLRNYSTYPEDSYLQFGITLPVSQFVDNFYWSPYPVNVVTSISKAVLTNAVVDPDDLDASITLGFGSLVPWFADVVDHHIPLVSTTRVNFVNVTTTDTATVNTGTALVKEHYIPGWYNVRDLVPVSYNMFNGLFDVYPKANNANPKDKDDTQGQKRSQPRSNNSNKRGNYSRQRK